MDTTGGHVRHQLRQARGQHQQTARLSIEKRKKGKRVTVIRGLPAEGNDLPELLKQIKDRCGAGGALKDEDLEIQGEQLDRVRETLQQMGFKVKG